jgi:hypothetical protein
MALRLEWDPGIPLYNPSMSDQPLIFRSLPWALKRQVKMSFRSSSEVHLPSFAFAFALALASAAILFGGDDNLERCGLCCVSCCAVRGGFDTFSYLRR